MSTPIAGVTPHDLLHNSPSEETMVRLLRLLVLAIALLAVDVPVIAFAYTHALTTTGVVVGLICLIMWNLVAFVVVLVRELPVQVRAGLVAAFAILMGAALFTTGPFTAPNKRQVASMEQNALDTSYIQQVVVGGCGLFGDPDIASGVAVSEQGSTCIVTIDSSRYSVRVVTDSVTMALMRQDITAYTVTLTFPSDRQVDLFLLDVNDLMRGRYASLPGWAVNGGLSHIEIMAHH